MSPATAARPKALGRHDAKGARDRAILRQLWDPGPRRFEVTDLEYLHLGAGTVDVRGKGQKGRGLTLLRRRRPRCTLGWPCGAASQASSSPAWTAPRVPAQPGLNV